MIKKESVYIFYAEFCLSAGLAYQISWFLHVCELVKSNSQILPIPQQQITIIVILLSPEIVHISFDSK